MENFLPLQCAWIHISSKDRSSGAVNSSWSFNIETVDASGLRTLTQAVLHLWTGSENNADENAFVFAFYGNDERIRCDSHSSAATWPWKFIF